jgi:hypothetical protein
MVEVVPGPAILICSYGADPQLQAPAIAVSRGRIGGYFRAGISADSRSRFHLSVCGWAVTAPNGNPATLHATVIQTNRGAREPGVCLEHCLSWKPQQIRDVQEVPLPWHYFGTRGGTIFAE